MSGGRRSGSMGLSSLQQLLGGQSQSGTNEAQASGPRGTGTKERTSFGQKTKINANEMDPSGTIVGSLPFDGEAPTGESLLKIRQIVTSDQASAQTVERQAIPVQHRELVRKYHEALIEGAPAEDAGEATEK